LEFNEGLALSGRYDLESGYNAMQEILDMKERPTAVFCSNDEMALGAMKAIKQRDIEMPDVMSIAGFDDMGFTAYLTPALTTILRPIEDMSRESSQILMNKIESNKFEEPGTIHFNTKLIIRDSVRKIN
jgi:LacI family transcriptional regulator